MTAKKRKLKAIDLFAGVGGIRLGFDYAFNESAGDGEGLETVFVCEKNPNARKTYVQNFPKPSGSAGWGFDIRKEEVKEAIPSFDICLAGFPCQAFSYAGRKGGFEDVRERGSLFFDVRDICLKHRPAVIFCENVRGLFTFGGKKGKDGYRPVYREIRNNLIFLGYQVYETILNSLHFGVPQHRERLYIVAIRNDVIEKAKGKGVAFTFPTNNSKATVSKQWEAHTLQDIRDEGPIAPRYYISAQYLATLVRHKEAHAAKGHGFGYKIREWNETSGAILCSNMGRERNMVRDENHEVPLIPPSFVKGPLNDGHIRRLTPWEFMKLQGFPRDFKTEGIPVSHLYEQFGNSVTVPVIESIAREIRRVLQAAALCD